MEQSPPLNIRLAPSRRLRWLLLLVHLLAIFAIFAAFIPAWCQAVLLLAVGASLARTRKAEPDLQLRLHGDGRIEKILDSGEVVPIELYAQTRVLAYLVVLLYRQQGRTLAFVVLPDSLPDEDFRQLRIWLRWRAIQ